MEILSWGRLCGCSQSAAGAKTAEGLGELLSGWVSRSLFMQSWGLSMWSPQKSWFVLPHNMAASLRASVQVFLLPGQQLHQLLQHGLRSHWHHFYHIPVLASQ